MKKKALALFMAVCLVLSCIMVGAPAVIAQDETSVVPGVLSQERLDTAMDVLASLHVLEGYEDGTYGEANSITRAETAALVSRLLRGGSDEALGAPAVQTFTDVPTSHWAAGDIQFLKDLAILDGMGDGTFNPDGKITYAQGVKILTCALGYGFMAEAKGFPDGYLTAAANIKLLNKVTGSAPVDATRGQIFVMMYNALTIDFITPDGIKGEGVTYSGGSTILEEKFELEKITGLVQANDLTGIDSIRMAVEPGKVMIDNVVYEALDEDAAAYLGYTVNAYVQVDEFDEERGVLYAVEPVTKAKSVTVASKDIIDATVSAGGILLEAYDGEDELEFDIDADAKVLLNDVAYTGILDDEDLMPDFGSVTLVSTDGSKTYDLVKIESYVPMIIESIKSSTKQISGIAVVDGVLTPNTTYDLETEDTDLILTITDDGEEADFDDLTKKSVVYVRQNGNFTGIEIASDAIVEGAIDKTANGFSYIDGVKYDSIPGAFAGFTLGANVNAYLSKEDVVFYAKRVKASSNLEYGMLLDLAEDDGLLGNSLIFKVLKQDGSVQYINSAENMKFNGIRIGEPGATINEIISTAEATAPIASFQGYNYGGTRYDFANASRKYEQVIKFDLDANGDMKTLYTAIPRSDNPPEDYAGLVVDTPIRYNGVTTDGRVMGTSYTAAQAVAFFVPGEVEADSDYTVRQGTPGRGGNEGIMLFDVYEGKATVSITLGKVPDAEAGGPDRNDKYIVFSHMEPTVSRDEDGDLVETYEYFFYQSGHLTSRMAETQVLNLEVGDFVQLKTYSSNGYISRLVFAGEGYPEGIRPIRTAISNISSNTYGFISQHGSYSNGYPLEFALGVVERVDGNSLALDFGAGAGYLISNVMGDCVKYDCETGYIEPCSSSDVAVGDVVLVQSNRANYVTMIIFENPHLADVENIKTENKLED